jgi:hypothetical protein
VFQGRRPSWLCFRAPKGHGSGTQPLAIKLTFIASLRSDTNSNALMASASENTPLKMGPTSIRSMVSQPAKQLIRKVLRTVVPAPIRSRLRPYRPFVSSIGQWNTEYANGRWDYLEGLREVARYNLLVG